MAHMFRRRRSISAPELRAQTLPITWPTSPDHQMSGSTDGGSAGTPETTRGMSTKFKSLKKLIRPKRPTAQQVASGQGWVAKNSNLRNDELLQILDEVKQGLSVEEALEKVAAREAELKMPCAPDPLLMSPPLPPESPGQTSGMKHGNPGSSADVSPITPSDTDSARGATASDGSAHNYDDPPDPESMSEMTAAIKFDEEDDDDIIGFEKGLMYRNPLAIARQSDEEEDQDESALIGLDRERQVKSNNNRRGSTPAHLPGTLDYLEPTHPKSSQKRGRSTSTPAVHVNDPQFSKGRSIFGKVKDLIPNMPRHKSPSPEGSALDVHGGSEVSDGSLDQFGTMGSSTSTCSSSKSAGETELQQPSYEVEPHLLDSQGEYCGPYKKIAQAITDVDPSPHDVTLLPLKKGDKVYVTKNIGGYWEGIQGKRRGNFKFIHVELLSQEELEKDKLGTEEDTDDIQIMPTFGSLKELLEVIECDQYFTVLYLHDFGTLEQFKHLEEEDLFSLKITDQKHIVKLTTAAQMLRNPKADFSAWLRCDF